MARMRYSQKVSRPLYLPLLSELNERTVSCIKYHAYGGYLQSVCPSCNVRIPIFVQRLQHVLSPQILGAKKVQPEHKTMLHSQLSRKMQDISKRRACCFFSVRVILHFLHTSVELFNLRVSHAFCGPHRLGATQHRMTLGESGVFSLLWDRALRFIDFFIAYETFLQVEASEQKCHCFVLEQRLPLRA